MRQLIGKWKSDENDPNTLSNYGRVTQTFYDDGRLLYVIHSDEKDQVIRLVYSVDGDELVTNQPSAPVEYRTKFAFDDQGRLVLDQDGERSRFVRIS